MNAQERHDWIVTEHEELLACLGKDRASRVYIAQRTHALSAYLQAMHDAIPPEMPKAQRDELGEMIARAAMTLSHIVLVWTSTVQPDIIREIPTLLERIPR